MFGDNEAVFPSLEATGTDDDRPTEIESFCVNCEDNGLTRLLLTKIPLYKEVIIASFECPHCGYKNNEIQSGGKIQEHGVKLILKVENAKDLDRQVVKSEYVAVQIPEVDLEIPSCSRSGEITTIEGIICRVQEDLKLGQEARKLTNEPQANAIDAFLEKLQQLLDLTAGFTLIINDPSGNSFIENPDPLKIDVNFSKIQYQRSLDENKLLGLVADDVELTDEQNSKDNFKDEVLHFDVECPSCSANTETNMKIVDIPHFKEVVIMATSCSNCGHRTNEVKSGAGIAENGIRLNVHVASPNDFARDVLKSETCAISIPELEIEAGHGILGGKFTTVEGILKDIRQQLGESCGLVLGDSVIVEKRDSMQELLAKFDDVLKGVRPVHLVLDDPAGNSYIQNLYAPEPDPRLTIESYQRNFEQNEELGINDMVTENYEEVL